MWVRSLGEVGCCVPGVWESSVGVGQSTERLEAMGQIIEEVDSCGSDHGERSVAARECRNVLTFKTLSETKSAILSIVPELYIRSYVVKHPSHV